MNIDILVKIQAFDLDGFHVAFTHDFLVIDVEVLDRALNSEYRSRVAVFVRVGVAVH